MNVLYLAALLVCLAGTATIDRRYRLFLWRRPGAATATLVIGVAFFLAWDLCGIGLGIFLRGDSPYLTGILLAPELPLEELFFLTFLCYLTMVLLAGARRLGDGRGARGGGDRR